MDRAARLDPRRLTPQETLPESLLQCARTLIRDKVSVPSSTFNMEKVTHEIEFFKEHVVILKFVSESSAQGIRGRWLSDLEHAIRPGIIQHQREAGFGFVYIKLDKSKSMRRALVLSLFQCSAGTATLHRWVPAFNPLRPALFIPAWITLNYLPLEYVDEADKVAVAIGRILEVDLAAQEQSIL
jgi:hypothetical protein